MTITPTFAEHVTLRGTPLSCPAWETTDLASLWSTPDLRGGDVLVPYAPGVRAGRRVVNSRRVAIPLVVFGTTDPDGEPYADARIGLRANLDALALLMRPGAATLELHMPDGSVRAAEVHPVGAMQVEPMGPTAASVILELLIPSGVWNDLDPTVASGSFSSVGVLNVSNPGTADQWRSVITLSGTASSVVLRNTSMPNNPRVTVAADLDGGTITLDTGDYTALQGSTSVAGSLTPVGHRCWLPLGPGVNHIEVTPAAGTATVSVTHYAPFA
jgi:hypothetical protein